MSAIDTLVGKISVNCSWNAQRNKSNAAYAPVSNAQSLLATYTFKTADDSADQVASFISSIAINSTLTISLASITNVLNETVSFSSVSGIIVRLLSVDQDSASGTICNKVNVSPDIYFFQVSNIPVYNGGEFVWITPSQEALDISSHTTIAINNPSGSNAAAAVEVTIFGKA